MPVRRSTPRKMTAAGAPAACLELKGTRTRDFRAAQPPSPTSITMSKPTTLQIRPAAADPPLTPEQRKFNQLVRKIEQARAELLAWQEQVPLFAQAHAQRMRPLLEEMAACRRQLVLHLDALLAQKGWTRTERRTMRQCLCNMVGDLIQDEHTSADDTAGLKALHDKHADIAFDAQTRDAMDAMKDLFETMSGVDLGDEAFESEDSLMQRARERLQAQAQAQADAQEQSKARATRAGRPNAAQRRREQAAQEAAQSVREVYRKLASALHPDRSTDEADHATRTALMQRANQAYEAQDLLGLFALQLEIEQVDAAHLARATAERAKHYNQVLTEQLGQLLIEIEARKSAFSFDYQVDPFQKLDPAKFGALLDRAVREVRAELAGAQQELRRLADPAAVKRWVKRMRQRQELDDDMLAFELPF
jgi:hypothetical protein